MDFGCTGTQPEGSSGGVSGGGAYSFNCIKIQINFPAAASLPPAHPSTFRIVPSNTTNMSQFLLPPYLAVSPSVRRLNFFAKCIFWCLLIRWNEFKWFRVSVLGDNVPFDDTHRRCVSSFDVSERRTVCACVLAQQIHWTESICAPNIVCCCIWSTLDVLGVLALILFRIFLCMGVPMRVRVRLLRFMSRSTTHPTTPYPVSAMIEMTSDFNYFDDYKWWHARRCKTQGKVDGGCVPSRWRNNKQRGERRHTKEKTKIKSNKTTQSN